jgi:cytochrome c553
MTRTLRRRLLWSVTSTTVLVACITASAADFIDQRGVAAIHGDAAAGEAKAAVCTACHGPNGNAEVPMFPRLAGQRADYLYWELVKFKRGTRPESPMTAQAATLDDADMRNLAAYFAAQIASAPAAAATSDGRGENLFHRGDPTRGTPPCQGCHGADAGGVDDPRMRTYPALRGQHADYVVGRLKAWREGTRHDSSNDFIMQGVAATLDDEAIASIAAWLAVPTR